MRAAGSAPRPRSAHNIWTWADKLFLAGGKDMLMEYSTVLWFDFSEQGSSQQKAMEDDTLEIEWQEGTSAPEGFSHAAVGVNENTAYITGIWSDSKALAYHMETDSWEEVTTTGDVPDRRLSAAYAQNGDSLFIFGGEVWDGQLNIFQDAYMLDLSTLVWKQLEDMPFPLTRSAAAWTDWGCILFGGLLENDSLSNATLVYKLNTTGVQEREIKHPNISLSNNYPNPFNPTTQIDFTLTQAGHAEIILYNVLGNQIKTLVNDDFQAGTHTIHLNMMSYPTGIYFYQLKTNGNILTRKLMYLQ